MLIKIKGKLNSEQQNNQPQVETWNLFNSLLISHIHFYLFIETLNAQFITDSGWTSACRLFSALKFVLNFNLFDLLPGMIRMAWFDKIFIMYKSETQSICTQTAMPSISFSEKQFKKLQSHFVLIVSMEKQKLKLKTYFLFLQDLSHSGFL